MNPKVIPKNRSMDMKEKHGGTEEWKLFARRVQKNPFVKSYLLLREHQECAWCGWKIDNGFVTHHIDYDHVCGYKIMREYPNPTVKRPNRVVKVPDCESCSRKKPDLFSTCMSKLAPVHRLCNAKIEKNIDAFNR